MDWSFHNVQCLHISYFHFIITEANPFKSNHSQNIHSTPTSYLISLILSHFYSQNFHQRAFIEWRGTCLLLCKCSRLCRCWLDLSVNLVKYFQQCNRHSQSVSQLLAPTFRHFFQHFQDSSLQFLVAFHSIQAATIFNTVYCCKIFHFDPMSKYWSQNDKDQSRLARYKAIWDISLSWVWISYWLVMSNNCQEPFTSTLFTINKTTWAR